MFLNVGFPSCFRKCFYRPFSEIGTHAIDSGIPRGVLQRCLCPCLSATLMTRANLVPLQINRLIVLHDVG